MSCNAMNVVLVVPGGVDKSGKERVVPVLLWLIEHLAQRHQVLVVALSQYEQFCDYSLLGAKVVNLGQINGRINELKLPRRLWQFRRAINLGGWKPDVVHAFGAGECGVLATMIGRWWRVPVVVSIWSGELVWLPQIGYGWQANGRSRLPVSTSIRLAQAVTAGSQYALKPLNGQGHCIPLGVVTDALTTSVKRLSRPPWRLLHVAHVNRVKDQETLLKAVRFVIDVVPDVVLDWFGTDTLNGRLQAEVSRLQLKHVVRFHGQRPFAELIPFYQQAHLFVQSSLHESQGVAVCEAAAAGVPTVGTAVGLVAELAPQAATAVPVGDASAIAQAIIDLLHQPSKRETMGQVAQQWAFAHDMAWTVKQFETLYSSVMD